VQALWGEAEEGRKLKFADDTCAAYRAIQLCDDEGRGTTGAGLGDKWHLGYSNDASLARFLLIVNSFDKKSKILVSLKFI
jgi:hypothetical protein